MRVHLRADEANGTHTKFTVFMNEVNCGELCMLEKEAIFFHHIVGMSTYAKDKEVITSGRWTKEE